MPNIGAIVVTPNSVADSDRIVAAFGKALGLFDSVTHDPRVATKAEIQQAIAQYVMNTVLTIERDAASSQATGGVQPVGVG